MVERIQGDSLPLHLLSCESTVFVKKKPDRKKSKKKSKLWFTTCENRLSVYVDEERLESFTMENSIIQKPVLVSEQINKLVSIRQEPPS